MKTLTPANIFARFCNMIEMVISMIVELAEGKSAKALLHA